MLIRYGFHGYGNPENDNGIVIFAGDRLVIKELVCEIPHKYLTISNIESGFSRFKNIDELRSYFSRIGTQRAKELAEKIASINGNNK